MTKEREFTLNDLTAEGLANDRRWDALEKFVAIRVKLYPERYVDNTPPATSSNVHSLPTHGEVVTTTKSASPPEDSEKTTQAEEEKRQKVARAFLRGYVDDAFNHEYLKDGGLRIISNTRNAAVSQTFASIMSNYGEIIAASTRVRVDLDRQTSDLLKAPLAEVLEDKATVGAYFSSYWIAKGLPNQMRFSREEDARLVTTRLEEEYGFPMVRVDEKELPGTLAILSRDQRTIPALRETEFLRDLPFFADLFPTSSPAGR